MGEPSITRLTIGTETVRSYLHWGSPDFQVPAFADFVYWTWSTSRPWTTATWQTFLAGVSDKHLPKEPSTAVHFDLAHHYRIRIDPDGSLAYRYRRRRFDRSGDLDEWETRLEAHSRLELYQLARGQLAERRRETELELRARPGDDYLDGHLRLIDHFGQTASVWERIEQLDGAAGTPSLEVFHQHHYCGTLGLCSAWRDTFQNLPTFWCDPDKEDTTDSDL